MTDSNDAAPDPAGPDPDDRVFERDAFGRRVIIIGSGTQHPVARCPDCFRQGCDDSCADPDLPLANGHNRRCHNCGATWNATDRIIAWIDAQRPDHAGEHI